LSAFFLRSTGLHRHGEPGVSEEMLASPNRSVISAPRCRTADWPDRLSGRFVLDVAGESAEVRWYVAVTRVDTADVGATDE
jgi:hypothetical protein